MLTLCMIVKNEENNLKECLSKVADYADEIVIVDTGSSDNTKAIALEFTDKVYDFKWCNDFSKARNFSLSKANNDWILVLDADEYVTDFFQYSLEEFISNPDNVCKAGRIKRSNIMEAADENKKYIEKINRIFNKKYFHYRGTIHEQVTAIDGKAYETELVDITVEHVGYTNEALNRTNKVKRNIDLLEEAAEANPNDPYIYFQLGKSYYLLKDYRTANLHFEKALTFDLDFRLEYVEDLVETYAYSLINSGRYSEALIIENCFEFYKSSPDYHFIMGLVYMNNAKFTEAVESFSQCTRFTESRVEGITTYCSYYNIGVIYDVLGLREKAIHYYTLCVDYPPAKKRLKAQLN